MASRKLSGQSRMLSGPVGWWAVGSCRWRRKLWEYGDWPGRGRLSEEVEVRAVGRCRGQVGRSGEGSRKLWRVQEEDVSSKKMSGQVRKMSGVEVVEEVGSCRRVLGSWRLGCGRSRKLAEK
ncbi:hypothetical protein FNV43_RR17012 [Rhamnella rubrinervis]|uniref:Uncharacterized protein n=1 Tax=Rhamnella rubrinervis TaxID=2594499 RepID=A0A8K0ME81_9ROSA|nr:hypothetical protein FNV43_RR17012 [Rhamnella rubrinervis]